MNKGKIVFVIGLPGSGKSHYIHNFKKNNYSFVVIDDPKNLNDFKYAFENGENVIIGCPSLCNPVTLQAAVDYFYNVYNYSRNNMQFVYFENDKDKCYKNILHRNDGRLISYEGLDSFKYYIPANVVPLKIWQKEDDITHSQSDCRTDVGIAIGLIDGIISMARILKKMNINEHSYQEALKDLRSDEDVAWLLNENHRSNG